jgi:hypothetical protein
MELTYYRDQALLREPRQLPAATYNLAHTLLARSPSGVVFVPIRSMQYLAILDHEEFVFVDGARKSLIDIAWQHFNPYTRSALDEPVSYAAVYYHPAAADIMFRLQSEFPRALRSLAAKDKLDEPGKIIKLEIRRS